MTVFPQYLKKKCINSARFMSSSQSNLGDNLAERIDKVICKDCDYFLELESTKDNQIKYKCLFCNKDYSNKLDEKLKKRFKNTLKFSKNNISKFILLLRKGVYPYEYMEESEKFNEIRLFEKEKFFKNLYMKDIRAADYMHTKKACEDLDFYLKRDTFWLIFPKKSEKYV